MQSVIVILGPTASGKTRIAVKLAREIGGEIISADSMQIYRHMNIGTAKPNIEEMEGIKHYLIDEVNPDEEFSVAKFKETAGKYIREIADKGKIPIIAGGTGLYINSLIYNINFSETSVDWELRERLQKEANDNGKENLHKKLESVDPEAAKKIHINDVRRVIRALEVYYQTNKPMSIHQAESRLEPLKYNFAVIGLNMERENLYARINKRVDLMLEMGLLDEVKHLKKHGYTKCSTSMQGLGYKEILSYFRGELTYNEMVEYLKRETRRYAKRQLTWFRRIENVYWIDMDRYSDTICVIKKIQDYLARTGII